MPQSDPIPPDAPRLVSAPQLAKWLGINRSTVWDWVKAGRLPWPICYTARVYRFRVQEVRDYLDGTVVPSQGRP